MEFVLHILTCGAILSGTLLAIAVLPWSDDELDESVDAFTALAALPSLLLSVGIDALGARSAPLEEAPAMPRLVSLPPQRVLRGS